MEVYVITFNDTGVYRVYTKKENAINELWSNYLKDVFSKVPIDRAKEFLEEDINTLRDGNYILDYGYVEATTIYGLEEKDEPAPTTQEIAKEAFWTFDDLSYDYICTHCRRHSEYATPFCPECGSKMMGMTVEEEN